MWDYSRENREKLRFLV